MKKKKLWLVTGVAAAAVLAAGTVTFAYQSGSDSEEQTVYKEVTVEKGNLTAGVTESGSVTIGTLDQTLDFSEDSSSASTHVVQSRYGIVGLAVGNGGIYVKTDHPATHYRPLPKTVP